jgi:DNA-binding CsgD family transcriptional regulator
MELDVRLTSGVPAYEYIEMVLNGREDARGCTGNVRDGRRPGSIDIEKATSQSPRKKKWPRLSDTVRASNNNKRATGLMRNIPPSAVLREETNCACPARRRDRDHTASSLSAGEVEVLVLVAEGLTDSQVAERLYLSPRTVGQHLRSVYRKLGVPSRAASAREAVERHLI